ncbi:hypothetical protein EDD16DRAFT_1661622, partial [Pisolithus croceorrhizus]
MTWRSLFMMYTRAVSCCLYACTKLHSMLMSGTLRDANDISSIVAGLFCVFWEGHHSGVRVVVEVFEQVFTVIDHILQTFTVKGLNVPTV